MTVTCVTAKDDITLLHAVAEEWERVARQQPDGHMELTFPVVLANARDRLGRADWYCYAAHEGAELKNGLFGVHTRLERPFWRVPIFRIAFEYVSDPLDASTNGRPSLEQIIRRMMKDHRDCAMFEFGHLREEAFRTVQDAARRLGLRYASDPSGHRFLFDTSGPLSDLVSSLGRRLRRNLRRERRRLLEQWAIDFEVVNTVDLEHNRACLEQFMDLEAAGWKGRAGTAIRCEAWHRDYYRWLVEQASPRGEYTWYTLKADGRPIAMYMCLRTHATEWALKTCFDEAFASYSPGNQLLFRIVERLTTDPEVCRLHMVTGAPWLAHWKLVEEPHYRVRLFGDTFGGRLSWYADRVRSWLDRLR